MAPWPEDAAASDSATVPEPAEGEDRAFRVSLGVFDGPFDLLLTLISKHELDITEVFADPETGAIHYGTTDALLVNLGINSLDELPHISPLLDDGANGFEEAVR